MGIEVRTEAAERMVEVLKRLKLGTKLGGLAGILPFLPR